MSMPSRPSEPRDSGDAWVFGEDGSKFWGRFGAAGLLVCDEAKGVLLQHRAAWSHHGGTWGLPGGARHDGESAMHAALREANEEAGVPAAALRVIGESVFDKGFWSYTTVIAEVIEQFDAVISDPESIALEWVHPADVELRPLHPGFAAAWPALRLRLPRAAAG